MINHVKVDGFRSLIDFKLDLRSGLNILVGPNGAGKTNIILFFEFLSSLFDMTIAEAVNKCGGAGSIFTRTERDDTSKDIRVSIAGKTRSVLAKREPRWVHYEYDFVIRLSEEDDLVFFKEQVIRVSTSKLAKTPSRKNWDAIIRSEVGGGDSPRTSIFIQKIDLRKTSGRPLFGRTRGEKKGDRLRDLTGYLEAANDPGLPLLVTVTRIIEELREVIGDFHGGEALNIVPSVTKLHEDSATPPGVDRDGSGLAATLYYLQRLRDRRFRDQRSFRRRLLGTRFVGGIRVPVKFTARPNTLAKINEFVTLLNPEILEIGVDKDHEENKLKIYVLTRSEGGPLKLPFSLMSDGTVKWIALVTAIFTSEIMFAIEEPENFIHPLMQQEVLKLMREVSLQEKKNYFVLLTTHSETLLNAASPKEVIVVTMEEGRSIARRPDDADFLIEEISRSGFGLGHLYLTGVLNDA